MGSTQREALNAGFMDALATFDDELLAHLTDAQAYEQGVRAANYSVAPILWAQLAGDRLDTSEVCGLLGITRQAVNKRVAKGTLLGLPGRGTTHFPVWQFDTMASAVRDAIPLVLNEFREVFGSVDPYLVVSWSATPQPELGGLTPQDWILKGQPVEPLVTAASRAATEVAH